MTDNDQKPAKVRCCEKCEGRISRILDHLAESGEHQDAIELIEELKARVISQRATIKSFLAPLCRKLADINPETTGEVQGDH